jgi:ATP-dependent Clp protease ATP-binding subunit ClpC
VEDNLSEALLAGEYKEGDTALLDVDDTGNPVVSRHVKPDPCEHGLCLPVLKTLSVSSSD